MRLHPPTDNVLPRVSPPPEKHRKAWALRQAGWTYKAIAEELGFKDVGYVSYICAKTLLWENGVRRDHG